MASSDGPSKGRAPGEHLVGDDAEGVQVGPAVHRLGGDLLRRGIRRGPEELVRLGERRGVRPDHVDQAEVDHLPDDLAGLVALADHVGGLQVAVHQSAVVGELQRRTERRHHVPEGGEVEPSARRQRLAEARSVQVLHHQVGAPFRVDGEVEDRDDVRMPEARGGAALTEEALAQDGGVLVGRAHDLDRDLVAEEQPLGAIHLAHAADAEAAANGIASVEHGAGSQHGGHSTARID